MPKQRKLFSLSNDAIEQLSYLSDDLGMSMSAVVENLISLSYRHRTEKVMAEELCKMVYDQGASEVRFEDMAGGVLAVFHLSE